VAERVCVDGEEVRVVRISAVQEGYVVRRYASYGVNIVGYRVGEAETASAHWTCSDNRTVSLDVSARELSSVCEVGLEEADVPMEFWDTASSTWTRWVDCSYDAGASSTVSRESTERVDLHPESRLTSALGGGLGCQGERIACFADGDWVEECVWAGEDGLAAACAIVRSEREVKDVECDCDAVGQATAGCSNGRGVVACCSVSRVGTCADFDCAARECC
jgi:hypothetical protein